jgi:hypothetical protein
MVMSTFAGEDRGSSGSSGDGRAAVVLQWSRSGESEKAGGGGCAGLKLCFHVTGQIGVRLSGNLDLLDGKEVVTAVRAGQMSTPFGFSQPLTRRRLMSWCCGICFESGVRRIDRAEHVGREHARCLVMMAM